MRALLLMAVRALFKLGCGERVMSAPLALSRVRNASLRYSHVPKYLLRRVWSVLSVAVWPITPLGQRGEARVDRVVGMIVFGDVVEIHSADETQSAAVVPTEHRDGLGQRDCLADRLAQIELVMAVQA